MKAVQTPVDAAYTKPDICLTAQRLTVFPCTVLESWGFGEGFFFPSLQVH